MHLYPGQLVYIPEENKIGIYLAWEEGKERWDDPTVYVYVYKSKDGSTSDTFIYEFKDLTPVVCPSMTTITKQELYKTPFQRDDFSAFIGDKTLETIEPAILAECQSVMRKKWFKEKYKLDLHDARAEKNKEEDKVPLWAADDNSVHD